MSGQKTDRNWMHPDKIGHTLVENEGRAVRVYLTNAELEIPLEPYSEYGSHKHSKTQIDSFEAIIDTCYVEDSGETVWGHLHIPEVEWDRIGLQKHWNHENAEDQGEQRILELWSSRFSNYEDYESIDYDPPVPDESILVKEWEYSESDTPIAPLDRMELTINVAYDESVRDYGNVYNQLNIGEISRIEIIDEICEEPEQRESKTYDIDSSEFSRHPTINYDDIEECEPKEDILKAVHTINRYAKYFNNEADLKYNNGLGAEARVCSLRKKALYSVKTVMIHKFVKYGVENINLSLHNLNDNIEMWCFEFPKYGYSFHQPKEGIKNDILNKFGICGSDDMPCVDISFNPSSDTDTGLELYEALNIIRDYNVKVNKYFESKVVKDYEWGYNIDATFN